MNETHYPGRVADTAYAVARAATTTTPVEGEPVSERKSVAVRDRHPMSVMWLALPQKQRKFSVLTMAVGVMFLAFNLILTGTSSDLNKNWLFVTFGLFVAVAFLPGRGFVVVRSTSSRSSGSTRLR